MFERPKSGERALLVHMEMRDEDVREELAEFQALAESAGAIVVGSVIGTRRLIDPKTFIGGGKVEEVKAAVQALEADVVLFNHTLRPSQERNLERLVERRVLDRTGLILDIFAQRARSHEGKLQVELAQLRHLSTRLVRGWTHLERQKGGIGLRGPGETQLETDRRLLGERVKQLQARLERVRQRRQQGRQARRKNEVPTVSVVGYTNAGKSTLFNTLTGATVYAANQLFATLDPTLRKLDLGHGAEVVIADTVGFIRHLPHDLVDAFHSTLQETVEADLLLHVIDAADPERNEHIEQVQAVLAEIGASDVPQIRVMNKLDILPVEEGGGPPRVERDENGDVRRVWVSAMRGEGLELLTDAVREHVAGRLVRGWLTLPASAGRARAQLFDMHVVVDERVDEQGDMALRIELPVDRFERLKNEGRLPGVWVAEVDIGVTPQA
ncbi:MAG: GTPase HflX [Chromatiales bacterium]|nr:GTPase HflX [Gammaproteobacteria bacterium]MCP5230782.1 GTPase HflX [Zoogloeaceae bacterium]MCP5351920.1 GTPase HflX [Chromatiales bacterium]